MKFYIKNNIFIMSALCLPIILTQTALANATKLENKPYDINQISNSSVTQSRTEKIDKDNNLSSENTFVSKEIVTTEPFRLATVKFDDTDTDLANMDDLKIGIKLLENNQWSDFIYLDLEEYAKESQNKNIFSEPILSSEASGYQVIIDSQNNLIKKDFNILLINDPNNHNTTPTVLNNQAADNNISQKLVSTTEPSIISRQSWGADETKMNWDLEKITDLKGATVHHTVTTNNYTGENAKNQIRAIYQYHAVELGWGDIGYHFIVDKFGNIYEGRTGSIEGLNKGGHVYGFNQNTFGVSALGNFEPGVSGVSEAYPTEELITSIGNLIALKLKQYKIDPAGTAHIKNNSPKPHSVDIKTVPVIHGHRDLHSDTMKDGESTLCPGKNLYNVLDRIRDIAKNAFTGIQHV